MARSKKSSFKTYCGTSPARREDDRLLRGQGKYVADVILHDPLHLAFVRCPVANVSITDIDFSDAVSMLGVVAAYCHGDVAHLGGLSVNSILGEVPVDDFHVLAGPQVLAAGQPVAAILADSPAQAESASNAVFIDFKDLDLKLSVDPKHPTATVIFERRWQQGNCGQVIAGADHVVEVDIQHPRLAPSPMENRAIAIDYDTDNDHLTIWLSTQTPHRARSELATILDIDKKRLRVIAPDVGGAFGMKASLYPEEIFAVWIAIKLQRSIKWISSRSQDLLSASHGRGIATKAKLAFSSLGKLLALEAEIRAPVGCWLTTSAAIPAWNAARILPGPYDIEAFDIQTCCLKTNTAPVGIYRGAGRPEAAMTMEQLLDKAAHVLGTDPMELRKQNLLSPKQLPHKRETGVILDSGNYPAALAKLCENTEYDRLKSSVARRRRNGEITGAGISVFVEPCGTGWESANVVINPDGKIIVKYGGSSQGHGRETALSQVAADALGCSRNSITVMHSDTATCPDGIGALASRSTTIGASAVNKACHKALQLSKNSLTPNKVVEASVIYENEGEAWGYGAYLAVVSIDRETGVLTVENITCVDDAGNLINPELVEGQIRGGISQGFGEAVMENIVFDDNGQLLTGSLADYALPLASHMPDMNLSLMQTPSPKNILGARGVGEAGTIGAPAAIYNAVIDALKPFNISSLSLPMTNHTIWRALTDAKPSLKGK